MKRSTHLGKRLLAFALVLCTITIVAFAAGYSRKVTTNIVVDGKLYSNTTNFEWDMEYVVPEGGIEWDGDPEYIYMPYFDDDDMAILPETDPNTTFVDYYVANRIYFAATETSDFFAIQQIAAKYGFRIIGYLAPTGTYLIESPTNLSYSDLQEIIENLKNEKDIVDSTVTLEYIETPVQNAYYPNDPWGDASWNMTAPEGYNWGVEAIKAPDAWNYRDRMAQLNVGVLDGFISPTHEDLDIITVMHPYSDLGEMLQSYLSGAFSESPFSHGTHVAGTFAARFDNAKGVSGVFPNGRIVAGCFNYLNEQGDELKTTNALEQFYIMRMRQENVRVINMSYGCQWRKSEIYPRLLTDPDYVEELFQSYVTFYSNLGWDTFFDRLESCNWDFVFVHSAGNDEIDAKLAWWPEAVSQVNPYFAERLIVVGSFGKTDWNESTTTYSYSDFSNYGSYVDIVAPGERIYSSVVGYTVFFMNNWYQDNYFSYKGDTDYWSGTSQAAPHVAGTAAMIWSLAPDRFTGPEVKQIILNNTSVSITSGHDNDLVNGRNRQYPVLDAGAAVSAAVSIVDSATPTPVVTVTPTPEPEATPTVTPVSTSEVTGTVIDSLNSPLNEVTVSVLNKGLTAVTDENGGYLFELPVGTYTLVFEKSGYQTVEKEINISSENLGWSYIVDAVVLIEDVQPDIEVTGSVVDESNNNIAGATVTVKGESISVTTDINGEFTLELPVGRYTLLVEKEGYLSKEQDIEVVNMDNFVNILDAIVLESAPEIPTVSGTVIDSKNQPLSDVTLTVMEGIMVVDEINVSGSFSISNLTGSEYTFVFSKEGYQDKSVEVNLGTEKEISLGDIVLYEAVNGKVIGTFAPTPITLKLHVLQNGEVKQEFSFTNELDIELLAGEYVFVFDPDGQPFRRKVVVEANQVTDLAYTWLDTAVHFLYVDSDREWNLTFDGVYRGNYKTSVTANVKGQWNAAMRAPTPGYSGRYTYEIYRTDRPDKKAVIEYYFDGKSESRIDLGGLIMRETNGDIEFVFDIPAESSVSNFYVRSTE